MTTTARAACPPRLKSIQRCSLALIFLICVINYIDRGTLSVANPLIRNELGLSVSAMGALLSAFLWPYAIALLFAGALVDRIKPRRVLTYSMIVWSLAQGLAGFVTGYVQFVIARVLLGIGEAPMFPAAARIVKDWYHEEDQATSVGFWNGASSLGTAIAPAILTPIMLAFGWRWMFMLMGIVGLVVAGIWYAIYKDFDGTLLDRADRVYLYGDANGPEEQPVEAGAWGRLFGQRATWGLIFGFFGIIYVNWLFITWLPGYLEMQRHITIAKTGFLAAVPFLFGLVGSVVGGWLADRMTRRGMTAIGSRKLLTIIGVVVMALSTLVAAETSSNVIAVGSISVAVFFGFSASGTSWSLANACAPPSYAASLGAIMDFGGFIGGALAPLVTGFVVQITGSFTPALLVAGAIGLASAVAYLIGIPSEAIAGHQLLRQPSRA